MNPQTQQFLENQTVLEAQLKAYKNQLIAFCEEKMKELDYKGLTETEYFQMKARIDTLEEIINYIKQ